MKKQQYLLVKNCIKNALAIFFVIFFCVSIIPVSVFASSVTNFDKTPVLEDLKTSTIDGERFNLNDYPLDTSAEPGRVKVISFVEYAYTYYKQDLDHYGLYVYVYNPSGKPLSYRNSENCIQLATQYDNTTNGYPTENSTPTQYEKFNLLFCSVSDGEYSHLFYKFKIKDTASKYDGKKIVERVNPSARRYDISGIELRTMQNSTGLAKDSEIALKYIFTGYAQGCGQSDQNTLQVRTDHVDTLNIKLDHTYWRSQSSVNTTDEWFVQNEVNTVFFAVDKDIFTKNGVLQRIKAEWYEYLTEDIVVTSDIDLYNEIYPYIGKTLTKDDRPLRYFHDYKGGSNQFIYNALPGDSYYYSSYNVVNTLHYLLPTQIPESYTGVSNPGDMFTEIQWSNGVPQSGVGQTASESAEASGGVSGARLLEYWKWYTECIDPNGEKINGNNGYSTKLFKDYIQSPREVREEDGTLRGKIVPGSVGKSVYDFDKDLDAEDILSWSDKGPSFFDNAEIYGFWNTIIGNIPQEDGIEDLSPLYTLSSSDFSGNNVDISKKLCVNYYDVDRLHTAYQQAEQNNQCLVLFRFAVRDYKTKEIIIRLNDGWGAPGAPGRGYHAQETVFFDFDVIQLGFKNNSQKYTVIPVVSDPIDIVNDITTPPWGSSSGCTTLDVLIMILTILAFALIIFILIKLGIIGLVFKGLWKGFVYLLKGLWWLIKQPFIFIRWLCRKIFKKGE